MLQKFASEARVCDRVCRRPAWSQSATTFSGLGEEIVGAPAAADGRCAGLDPRRTPLTRAWTAGIATSVRIVEHAIPPIIGSAMRFISSAPVPWLHAISKIPHQLSWACKRVLFHRVLAPRLA